MLIKGKYTTATVMTDDIEEAAINQILELCNQPYTKDAHLAIMPDVHAGKGCTIGTTMHIGDNGICPNLVGVDIGCGVLAMKLPDSFNPTKEDLLRLDDLIRKAVPLGHNVFNEPTYHWDWDKFTQPFKDYLSTLDHDYFNRSLGTLGGGNHFISIEKGKTGTYLLVHSGSRNLGVQCATFYQNLAIEQGEEALAATEKKIKAELEEIKSGKEGKDIGPAIGAYLDKLAFERLAVPPKALRAVTGEVAENYLRDMQVCQSYAKQNRQLIVINIFRVIIEAGFIACRDAQDFYFGPHDFYFNAIDSVHNYIDEDRILRKGSVAAHFGEKFVVPLNMRAGTLICRGLGNEDWNCSAPHGAGRTMSRAVAKATIDLEDYREQMQGIVTTSVSTNTLDEAPDAYKDAAEIESLIAPTAEVLDHLYPIYNLKADN